MTALAGRSAPCAWERPADGFRQEVAFTVDGMLTVTTLPLGTTIGAALICPAIGNDLVRGERREALFARRLAREGVASVRFHFRASGNSRGSTADLDWDGMLLDGGHALGLLRGQVPDAPLGVLGTRLGALVALGVGADLGPVPTVLWDPVPDLRTYCRDVTRVERLAALGNQGDDASDATPARASRPPHLPQRLLDEARTISVETVAGTAVGSILLCVLGAERESRPMQRSTAWLRKHATAAATVGYPDEKSWWPSGRPPERDVDEPWPVVDDTVEWLRSNLTAA